MRPRSPIEMMVYRACGFDLANSPKQVAVVDEETQALMNVGDAAKALYLAEQAKRDTTNERRILRESTARLIQLGW